MAGSVGVGDVREVLQYTLAWMVLLSCVPLVATIFLLAPFDRHVRQSCHQ